MECRLLEDDLEWAVGLGGATMAAAQASNRLIAARMSEDKKFRKLQACHTHPDPDSVQQNSYSYVQVIYFEITGAAAYSSVPAVYEYFVVVPNYIYFVTEEEDQCVSDTCAIEPVPRIARPAISA